MSKIQPNGISSYTTAERDALTGLPTDDYLIYNKTLGNFQTRDSSSWVNAGSTQPAFSAQLSSVDIDVTGDGTVFTIGSGNAFTELYDQGANFNTNGTFTAPVTGRYSFNMTVGYGSAGSNDLIFEIVTTGGTYLLFRTNADGFQSGVTTEADFCCNAQLPMTTNDTATIRITISGGSKIADINTNTLFSGHLVC